EASIGIASPEDRAEYAAVASTPAWAAPPLGSYRLFIDIYDNADFYDSEPNGDKQFPDRTVLSDIVRPVATVLWDEHFRFQAGAIAQRTFGASPDFSSIDPWVQLLWRPVRSVDVILGDLNVPHDYLPALVYAPNYFLIDNHETGMQLFHHREHWSDDLFFNERQFETPELNEKFDFGYTHHNDWKWLDFTYQAHWTHTGGDNFHHTYNTINDSAQTAGIGFHERLLSHGLFGGSYNYLHSHYRTDTNTASLNEQINGDGHFVQGYIRWSRLKLIFGYWHGSNFSHDGGDPYFTVDNMRQGIIHWDILMSSDFNLFGEITGYYIGNNSQHIDHYVKSTFLLEAAWHFGLPSKGWGGTPGENPPERWDTGL
ncbi:MAG TPA: hypothetical protein VMU17_00070, partial [Elusimicrobiota bacterium]|nr:hypothetical protein [Elusimicrobiota bacterium]